MRAVFAAGLFSTFWYENRNVAVVAEARLPGFPPPPRCGAALDIDDSVWNAVMLMETTLDPNLTLGLACFAVALLALACLYAVRQITTPRPISAAKVARAKRLQRRRNVPLHLCGPWYHVCRDKTRVAFDSDRSEVTWFTRSPHGAILWGEVVLVAYVTGDLRDSVQRESGGGDTLGFEGGEPLPRWWLGVPPGEINAMTVVGKYHTIHNSALAQALLDREEYRLVREIALVERAQAQDAGQSA